MRWNLPLWPDTASTSASRVDHIYIFLLVLCSLMAFLIFLLIIFFAVKYRASKGRPVQQVEGALGLELAWSITPLFIFLFIFLWGASVYFDVTRPPRGAEEIDVVAKQWMWKFQHMDGQREINTLHVPVGRDIVLTMVSQDVIHSFFVPAFRVKADVLPGRYTRTWFHATKAGTYHLFCAEFCGTMHSGMIGSVVVLNPADYQSWLAGGGAQGSMTQNGEQLFQDLGCITCHRSDGTGRGPNLVGVFGNVVHLADGRTVVADENYVRESILSPGAKVVAGFQPIMPNFQGQVTEEGVMALVAYVKSLGQQAQQGPEASHPTPQAAPPAGKQVQ
jgi:cytochrome c oxidase subunit 2